MTMNATSKIVLTGASVLSAVYVLLCAYMYFFQERFLYFPHKDMTANPGVLGLAFEEVRYDNPDGTSIYAWFVPAPNSDKVVLFCHGNGGNLSHRVETAKVFFDLGVSIFLFDYRGYGKSTGKPSEEGTYRDARGAWDYLVERRGYRPDQVILVGRSLGGAVASRLAGEKKPAGLVVESSFTSVPAMGARLYPFLPIRLLSRFDYNNLEHLERVTCPVLVVHSPDDEIVPYELGRELFAAVGRSGAFLEIRGSHNDGFLESLETYTAGLDTFFRRL